VLLAGAILAPRPEHRHGALRILGHEHDGSFCTFHRILNRAAGRRARRQAICCFC
jgi:hypothetical protein